MLAVEMLHMDMKVLVAEGVWQDCSFCERSLSNVMNANLLLFKTVVAIDSWGRVAVPLIERNPFAAFIFCGSQLSIVFGVLNLIVAVVVDQFAEQRTKDVSNMANELEEEADEEFRRLDKMFQLIDGDGDGELTLPELLDGAAKSREFQNRLRVMDIDQADLHQLFGMLDFAWHGNFETSGRCQFRRGALSMRPSCSTEITLVHIVASRDGRVPTWKRGLALKRSDGTAKQCQGTQGTKGMGQNMWNLRLMRNCSDYSLTILDLENVAPHFLISGKKWSIQVHFFFVHQVPLVPL